MGAVRIRNEYYTSESIRYRVDIWDSDYSGSIITSFEDDGFELSYDGESDTLCEPLKPSSVKYTLIDDGTTAFNSFRTDLGTAQENEFKLVIYRHNGTDFVIYWAGVIMTDQVSYPNTSVPRPFEIIAKDGLNRLANIPFDKINSSPYISAGVSTPQTFFKIIFDCLSYSETAQFWTSGPYIRVCTRWQDTGQFLDNSTDAKKQSRSLETYRIDRDFLFEREFDDKGQGWHKDEHWKWINQYGNPHTRLRGPVDPSLKARTILRELLQLLNLRIILSEGVWNIIQHSQYELSSNADFAEYNNTGTFTGLVATNIIHTPQSVLASGRFGYFPCIRTAKATIFPSDILNLTSGFSDVTLDKNTPTHSADIELGTLYGGSGTGLKLRVGFVFVGYNQFWATDKSLNDFIDLEFTLKFVIEDSTATDWAVKYKNVQNQREIPVEWTNTITDECIYSAKHTHFTNSTVYGSGAYSYFEAVTDFETPEIPFTRAEGCKIEVSARLYDTVTGSTLTGSHTTDGKVWIIRPEIKLIDENNSVSQITEYEVVNPNLSPGNSFDLDLGNLRIHDTSIISNKNSIEVDEYVGAGRWYKSGDWDAGYATPKPLVHTILREQMAFQKSPVEKYIGGFLAKNYGSVFSMNYDSSYWVFHSGVYNSKTDEWDCVWWKIIYDVAGINNVNETRHNTTDNSGSAKPHIPNRFPDITEVLPMSPKARTDQTHSGATTTINIWPIVPEHIRNSDVAYVIDTFTNYVIDTITFTTNVNANDTSLSIQSITPDGGWPNLAEISLNDDELQTSNQFRSAKVQSLGYGNNYSYATILKCNVTDSTPTELTLDGATGSGSDNRIKIPLDSSCLIEAEIVGKESGQAQTCTFSRKTLMINNGGTTSVANTQTIGTDYKSVSFNLSSVSITANDTEDAYILTFSLGGGFANANIMAYVHVTQLED